MLKANMMIKAAGFYADRTRDVEFTDPVYKEIYEPLKSGASRRSVGYSLFYGAWICGS
jgi:hypothetical protein